MDSATRLQAGLTLNRGELLRLRNAAGRHLTVVQGSVWITQDGDPRDPVLESGASFRFDRNGLSLVMSLGGPAILVLEEGLAPDPVGQRAWQLARSKPFQRQSRRMKAETLAGLSDHLLRDLGLRRERARFGGHTPDCAHC
ncbi:MAG: DUF2917 domain-containing protein [Betaproteobacteria bacterium]|nr:DUF2917 domain-containing protein [Betaproteobacteria bacterium]